MGRARIAWASGALLTGAAGLMLLYRFPPAQYTFYPQCPIHQYLHMLCPGCGATRALAVLLHGHLAEAVHFNAFFVAMLPFLAGYAVVCCYRAMKDEEFRWPEPPRGAMAVTLAAAMIFTVTRNLSL